MWWKVGIGIAIVGALGWIGWTVTRPVPGMKREDQGREHVAVDAVAKFAYNSNPPTSGPHLPTWVRGGVFDKPQSEGELIHSLEHGYVIISYNCNVHLKTQNSKVKTQSYKSKLRTLMNQTVFAHEEDGTSLSANFIDPTIATGSPSTGSTKLTTSPLGVNAMNDTDGCKTLVKNLTELANRKKLWKLAVVPRPSLTTTIALTAWTYIDAFDPPAGGLDVSRIERFIDYHRDQGPEKTME